MRRPFRQLVVADPQTLLPPSAPSRTHRHLFFSRMHSHSTRHTDEHKLLQVTKQISRLAPRAASDLVCASRKQMEPHPGRLLVCVCESARVSVHSPALVHEVVYLVSL